jgi:hypothetical protein
MTYQTHTSDVLAQGPRLNLRAAVEVRDVNAAHLIVHGVLARAMNGQLNSATLGELDADLTYALRLHVGKQATGAGA